MRPTPFHPRTSELSDPYNWSLWSGWLLADMFAPDHTQEYIALRTASAVFALSPIPKYHIHGPDALRFLYWIVTQDISSYAVGRVLYTPWCDDAGKIIDDGMLARLDKRFYRLTTGNPMLDQLFFMRPTPGWANYRTPIRNYYQCGSGTHPGGGITGTPGRLAALEIM